MASFNPYGSFLDFSTQDWSLDEEDLQQNVEKSDVKAVSRQDGIPAPMDGGHVTGDNKHREDVRTSTLKRSKSNQSEPETSVTAALTEPNESFSFEINLPPGVDVSPLSCKESVVAMMMSRSVDRALESPPPFREVRTSSPSGKRSRARSESRHRGSSQSHRSGRKEGRGYGAKVVPSSRPETSGEHQGHQRSSSTERKDRHRASSSERKRSKSSDPTAFRDQSSKNTERRRRSRSKSTARSSEEEKVRRSMSKQMHHTLEEIREDAPKESAKSRRSPSRSRQRSKSRSGRRSSSRAPSQAPKRDSISSSSRARSKSRSRDHPGVSEVRSRRSSDIKPLSPLNENNLALIHKIVGLPSVEEEKFDSSKNQSNKGDKLESNEVPIRGTKIEQIDEPVSDQFSGDAGIQPDRNPEQRSSKESHRNSSSGIRRERASRKRRDSAGRNSSSTERSSKWSELRQMKNNTSSGHEEREKAPVSKWAALRRGADFINETKKTADSNRDPSALSDKEVFSTPPHPSSKDGDGCIAVQPKIQAVMIRPKPSPEPGDFQETESQTRHTASPSPATMSMNASKEHTGRLDAEALRESGDDKAWGDINGTDVDVSGYKQVISEAGEKVRERRRALEIRGEDVSIASSKESRGSFSREGTDRHPTPEAVLIAPKLTPVILSAGGGLKAPPITKKIDSPKLPRAMMRKTSECSESSSWDRLKRANELIQQQKDKKEASIARQKGLDDRSAASEQSSPEKKASRFVPSTTDVNDSTLRPEGWAALRAVPKTASDEDLNGTTTAEIRSQDSDVAETDFGAASKWSTLEGASQFIKNTKNRAERRRGGRRSDVEQHANEDPLKSSLESRKPASSKWKDLSNRIDTKRQSATRPPTRVDTPGDESPTWETSPGMGREKVRQSPRRSSPKQGSKWTGLRNAREFISNAGRQNEHRRRLLDDEDT